MTVPTHQARDPHADPLVAAVARAADAVSAAGCPEAEVLALYAERELTSDERRPVEAHVADCGRCQALVAAFVRSAPEANASAEVGRLAAVPWWAGWRLMLPLASAAAVLAVAVWVGRGPADQAALSSQSERSAEAGPTAVPEVPAPSVAAGARALQDATAMAANALALKEPVAENVVAGRMQQAAPQDIGAATAVKSKTDAESKNTVDDKRIDALAADETREALAKAEADRPDLDRQRIGAAEGAAARPAAAAALATPAAAPAAAAAKQTDAPARAEKPDNFVERRSNEPATSNVPTFGWRVRNGIVERSVDQGKTWARTAAPTTERLATISASDARTAVVTTEAGVRFATADGGATWRRLP